jgi:hypothetical protein
MMKFRIDKKKGVFFISMTNVYLLLAVSPILDIPIYIDYTSLYSYIFS